MKDVKSGNYQDADDTVVSAYMNNFEYPEPAIDNLDHRLKIDIELGMRAFKANAECKGAI